MIFFKVQGFPAKTRLYIMVVIWSWRMDRVDYRNGFNGIGINGTLSQPFYISSFCASSWKEHQWTLFRWILRLASRFLKRRPVHHFTKPLRGIPHDYIPIKMSVGNPILIPYSLYLNGWFKCANQLTCTLCSMECSSCTICSAINPVPHYPFLPAVCRWPFLRWKKAGPV